MLELLIGATATTALNAFADGTMLAASVYLASRVVRNRRKQGILWAVLRQIVYLIVKARTDIGQLGGFKFKTVLY